ncbi:MAG TPA: PKD domain-containing protein, partial [Cytophagales bacterium]|nr:PKD domain-containing protein [Cytophagales bacterium]
MKKLKIYLIMLVCLMLSSTMATHIVGGIVNYRYLSSGKYEITLKVYRDCINPMNAPFDSIAFLSVFEGSSNYMRTELLENPAITTLPLNQPDPCVGLPGNVCVQQAIYTKILSLPSNDKGYTLLYQRCCRNATIRNITDPLTVGATYPAYIPDSNVVKVNSNPTFVSLPPVFLCNDMHFSYDHSAKDLDGDSLAYKFCSPRIGGDTTNSGAAPYVADPLVPEVPWTGGYNASYPIASNPTLQLDPRTGKLEGTPKALGQYVVGVCVEEYRAGKLIGYAKRDFQFNVVKCPPKPTAVLPIRIRYCGLDVSFTNKSVNASKYDWDFGVTDLDSSDQSKAFEPTFTYPTTGTYKVRLIINNETICADTAETFVDVYNKVVGTDFDVNNVCQNLPIKATDLSLLNEGTVKKRKWVLSPDGSLGHDSIISLAAAPGIKKLKLVIENEYGCTDSLEKNVEVFPLPKVMISGDPFICLNAYKPYKVTGNFFSVVWKNNTALSCTQCTEPSIKGIQTQKFYATGMDINQCSNTDSIEIKVPIVTASVTPNSIICYDNEFQLTASGGLKYQWFPSIGLNCEDCSDPKAKIKSSTSYSVTVSDIHDCKDTATVTLTTRSEIPSQLAPTSPVCYGKTSSLQLNAPTAQQILWNPSHLVDCNTCGQTNTVALTQSQWFQYTLRDAFACTKTDSIEVKVLPRQINFGDSTEICYGDSVVVDLGKVGVLAWQPPYLCQNCPK